MLIYVAGNTKEEAERYIKEPREGFFLENGTVTSSKTGEVFETVPVTLDFLINPSQDNSAEKPAVILIIVLVDCNNEKIEKTDKFSRLYHDFNTIVVFYNSDHLCDHVIQQKAAKFNDYTCM